MRLFVFRLIYMLELTSKVNMTHKLNQRLETTQLTLYPFGGLTSTFLTPFFSLFVRQACDGVWDVATNEQCSSFIQSLFDDGENDLGLICEEAIDTCLDKNSRDNMTIAVVTFDGLRTQQPSGLGISNAVWQRRATRHAKQLQQSAKDAATRAASNVGLLPDDAATTNPATSKSSKRSSVAVKGS
mmetsp:Transcript_58356/g.142705  ORF Transcript_58356/g.142705 Transcript_58356/m.142705 type:complete len:185 (+) Transcript_58356:1174-1728(+)